MSKATVWQQRTRRWQGEAAPPEEGPQAGGVVGAKDTRGTALAGAAALSQDVATREAIPKGAAATSQAAATRGTTSEEAAAPRQAEATRGSNPRGGYQPGRGGLSGSRRSAAPTGTLPLPGSVHVD